MRRTKRSGLRLNALFFALAVPAVLFFMVFSLMPYHRMVAGWPLGIRQGEVMAYQRIFDRRPGQHADANVPEYRISGGREGCSGPGILEAEGFRDSVTVDGQGPELTLRFPAQRPFEGHFALDLVRADLTSLPAKYAQLVASGLGLRTDTVELVRLFRCGSDEGLFLVQEPTTADRLRAQGPAGLVLFHPTASGPAGEGVDAQVIAGIQAVEGKGAAAFDPDAVSALVVMALAEERPELLDGTAGSLYDQVAGIITPLYGMRSGVRADSATPHPLRTALGSAAVRADIERITARLRADSALWDARFRAVDSTWVPALAGGRNLGLVQAEVDRRRERLLYRFLHPDLAGLPAPGGGPAQEASPALDPWLAQFRTEPDTIRFRRGKYAIDHDLVLPPGMALVLEKGTRWNIAPGVRVIINGALYMRGTDLNPVFLRPQAPEGYATVAVNGMGDTPVRIRGLRMSGGGEAWVEGSHHAGMLSLHRVDVVMTDCSFGGSTGPFTVSVRRGQARIEGCSFDRPQERALELLDAKGGAEGCAFGTIP